MSQLRVEDLRRNFGGLAALANVSLQVDPGERRAIIGPNGAGKTTLFNVIAGELPPTAGRVWLDDRDITGLPVHMRANLGLGHTFQRNNLFTGLTVYENVRLAVQHHHRVDHDWFRTADSFTQVATDADKLLDQLGIAEQRGQPVSTLAYGQQRALEIALALATQPTVLLLDEPTAGMSPMETADMVKLIGDLTRDLTILIVEHDMDVVFSLADKITVLHYGQVLAEGAPEQVRDDPTVQEIYLGTNGAA
ncbi:MAG: ABC transporter ATP-binding protein [Anaerolineales bacterium]